MKEYQYSVSIKGHFVFRTEWMDVSQATNTIPAMQSLMADGYTVRENKRDATFSSYTMTMPAEG